MNKSVMVTLDKNFFENYYEDTEHRLAQTLKEGCLKIESDAKDLCPVDTGNLRASIHTEIDEDNLEGYVGTPTEYAGYVEFGTKYQNAQPYLFPAFENNRELILRKFEKDLEGYNG